MNADLLSEAPLLGIALGGGAARGLCHIGVLKVLSAEGITFPVVAGTSMGAIIGAAYVSGRIEEAEKIARSVNARTMASWADVNLRTGALKGDVVKGVFRKLAGDMTFRDLRDRGIRFTVVAADLGSEEPVYIREGRVDEAVRASMSIPGVFEPIALGGRVLVDGGLIDNVPIEAARALGAQRVIGVEVHNPYDIWLRTALGIGLSLAQVRELKAHLHKLAQEPHVPWQRSFEAYRGMTKRVAEAAEASAQAGGTIQRDEERSGARPHRIGDLVSRLHAGDMTKSPEAGATDGWTALRAALAALDIVTSLLERGREPFRANAPADLFIRPDVRRFHAHQFYRASHLIAAGERAAIESLPRIKDLAKGALG